jgi:hypothetical protein
MPMSTADGPRSRTVLHPASGALILGLDWLLFADTVATLGLATLPAILVGFGGAGVGTGLLQRRYGGDSWGAAVGKGLLAGAVVGVPLPIAGTVVGGGIIALSGLDAWPPWGRRTPPDAPGRPPSADAEPQSRDA